MPTPAIYYYEQFITNIGVNNVNLVSDDFKMILVDGYVYDSTDDELSDVVAFEIASGNGYTSGGKSLTNITLGYDAANSRTRWDADDLTWNATGGLIGPATGGIIYSSTSTGDKLIGYWDFDDSVSAGDGTDLKVTFNADGLAYINV